MRNLIPTTEAQRAFYALALAHLKISLPVLPETVRVDRAGWSPEVAAALVKNGSSFDYLRVGGVQYAVIVSPRQEGAPVLVPAHSFDGACLSRFFADASSQICNLTERGAVIVTMARNVDEVGRARNLQQVEHVAVEATDTAGAMAQARLQRDGAARIRETDDAVFDEGLRASLVESARRFGDLRHEALEIPRSSFSDLRSFYTATVAGGSWIFRDLPSGKVLTVVRECEPGEKASSQYAVLSSREEGLQVIQRLLKAKLLRQFPPQFQAAAKRAQAARTSILTATARDLRPDLELVGMDDIARRRLASSLRGSLPPAYDALDQFASAILQKGTRDDAARLVREEGLCAWLAEPASDVSPGTAAALNSLLSAVGPEDVLRLREFDRLTYRARRHEWPKSYVDWVDEQISLPENK